MIDTAARDYVDGYFDDPFARFLAQCVTHGLVLAIDRESYDSCEIVHVGGAHVLHYWADGSVTRHRLDVGQTFDQYVAAQTRWIN